MKILSVDDSGVVRKIIRTAIAVLGYEFTEAEDGEGAFVVLEEEHSNIDLILLDWNMPGMNGYEVLQKLKADERFRRIPVMMVTTESEKSNVALAVRAGAVNYLTKPFSSEDLLVKIMECVGGEE